MNRLLSLFLTLVLVAPQLCVADPVRLDSPDKRICVEIDIAASINYKVYIDGNPLFDARIGLTVDSNDGNYKVKSVRRRHHEEVLYPVVWQKQASIEDNCNVVDIVFRGGKTLQWRAYDNGVAYRWVINSKRPFKVEDEEASYKFTSDTRIWYPNEESFYSANEQRFTECSLDELGSGKLASLPTLLAKGNTKILITESDLRDYAGMWLLSAENGAMEATFPRYPKTLEKRGDRDEFVREREEWIATFSTDTELPWRICAIATDDKELLSNTLVYQLAEPSQGDFSWVKPGNVQWDWWNDLNLTGVDFVAGLNTETYKYYIDFAASHGIDYVLFDEGWSVPDDIMHINHNIDVQGLIQYASTKGIGVVLWCTWLRLDENLDKALEQFAEWGVKGIKVDFMSRDDQPMVQYYSRVADKAAEHRLMVDFHGCYKPTGLYRTYPNVVSFEGVYGMEQSKVDQSKRIGPDHNLILPFTRMVAGPMDYTPGAMVNAHKKDWTPLYSSPMGMGTRCHNMAMYVVFESPLQMLCDSPSNYLKEGECFNLIASVPTVWKTTVPIAARVGEYVAVARESAAGEWYIGAMTGSEPKTIDAKLDFLPDGEYIVQVWQDGPNAEKNANDYSVYEIRATNKHTLNIRMCSEGGCIVKIIKQQ